MRGMHYIFTTFFYAPLYNGLIFFISIIPFHNVGVAVILFTLIIKILLFPLSQKAVRTQFEMKRLEPELNALKSAYKDNKQLQAEKTMELYRERGINPFAGILVMFIQLPVLLALYMIFSKSGLPNLDHTALYSFTRIPDVINITLFGASVAGKSIIFALGAAIAQFFQMQVIMPKQPKKSLAPGAAPTFGDELSRSMSMQMKYFMPVVIFFIGRSFPAVVSLYLITSSLFAIGQEIYVKRHASAIAAK